MNREFLLMLLSAAVVSAAAGPARADYSQLAKLTASDAALGDNFGNSVALSGTTALVGAPYDYDAGSAYLYDFSDPCNIIETKLTASDAAADDVFGNSVALSGTTALVGAYYDDNASTNSGSAYLFDFSDPCNITEIKLIASDAAAFDYFGWSVAISGTTALVGVPYDGSAYLYDFSDPYNIIETKLTASAFDKFGWSVALSGTTAIVGAYLDDDYAGSAYLYDFSDPYNIIETKLTASDAATYDKFGFSVAISGSTALVGAYGNDDAGNASGSAYLYNFSDPCNIIETKLTASDAAAVDYFGFSVALSGTTAIVGAYLDDDAGNASGSAYLYNFSDPCNIIETKLTASDAAAADQFGFPVALSGTTALVGAWCNDDAGSNSGSAYLFGFCLFPPVGDINLDCGVDLRDFTIFGLAWKTEPGDAAWDPNCDISDPNDDIIDNNDLDVFTDHWLE